MIKKFSFLQKLSVKNKQCNTISKALISAVKEDRKSESFAKQPTMVTSFLSKFIFFSWKLLYLNNISFNKNNYNY